MCCKAQMHGHEKKGALMAQELILYTLLNLCAYLFIYLFIYIYVSQKHTHNHHVHTMLH